MSDDLDWVSLDRYFCGTATPGEVAAIESWVADDPEHAAELEMLRRIWEHSGARQRRFDVQAAKARMHAKMGAPASPPLAARRAPHVALLGGRRTWAIAAGLAALMVGAMIGRVGLPRPTGSRVAAVREYETRRGQRREFRLPDGTNVVLGPQSRLVVGLAYGARAREVRLEGQGYFDVVHDAKRPFMVRVGGAVVRDIGTKFDVRAYATDRGVRVAVAEGRVAMDGQVLVPGQIGEYGADARLTVRSGVDLERYLAWTKGRLVFNDTPLVNALPDLSRWYDLDFQLADSGLGRLPLTGTLNDQLNRETLDLLALALGAHVEHRGATVVIGRR